LPPYSPEFNPIEGVWKVTKKRTTHNRFYKTTEERDAALCSTFDTFKASGDVGWTAPGVPPFAAGGAVDT